jgi:hypothetical protein
MNKVILKAEDLDGYLSGTDLGAHGIRHQVFPSLPTLP